MRAQLLSRLSVSLTLFSSLAFLGCGSAPGVDDSLAVGALGSELSKKTSLVVKDTNKAVFTSGVATNDPPVSGQPSACSDLGVKCFRFDLEINLPKNTWESPGGVQVAIRWPDDTNVLDLYVYRHDVQSGQDVQVGNSTGILAAMGGSLLLRSAANDTYQVYVALDPANSDPSTTSVPFDAEARVQFDPKVKPVRPLLPDFAMRPQTKITFDTPNFPFFGDEPDPDHPSCYKLEVSEDSANVCMRFEQTFANIGEGPAELHFAVPKPVDPPDPAPGQTGDAFARTYYSDGHTVDTVAGNWEWHEAHHHYHYDNFVQSNLWAADSKGHRVGTAPVRVGRKVSFCMEDEKLDDAMWGESGVRPRRYVAPDCLFFVEEDANFKYIVQGLQPGWDDIYQWYLPGQYIDVAGLPNGKYVLETIADPDDTLVESNEANNCGTVLVSLRDVDNANRHAEIIGAGPGCGKKK